MRGEKEKVSVPLLPKRVQSVDKYPNPPLKVILGYKSATRILYSATAPASACSARYTSGRRFNKSVGLPTAKDAGTSGKDLVCVSAVFNFAVGFPVNTPMRFSATFT